MSSDIIYHQLALRFGKDITGTPEDLYAIVTQIGSSNCYEMGNGPGVCGRRSRHWQALALGTAGEVLQEAIRISGSCEGGSLKMRHARGDVTPEQYITSARNMLKRAANHDVTRGPVPFKEGHIRCHFCVPVDDGLGVPRKTSQSIYPSDGPALQTWLASVEFARWRSTVHPSYLLHVSGPEIRR